MQSLPNVVKLSQEAAAVLKRARDASVRPTRDTGVWVAVEDAEANASDALAIGGYIEERFWSSTGQMMAAITDDGLAVLLDYEAGERACAAESGAR
jgi:hypothetical protein